ncbi:hypothetical protein [Lactobacillus koreensis] [Lactiplantibacillus mudanjiangensis]|nr:hypothetical protein [Lactobacillus koreensis] [Lactiplantibacillus mudanjiangensis]
MAAKQSKYLPSNTTYVRTKKAMTVGIKEKVGSKYKLVKVRKNTLLKISATSVRENGNSDQTTALFTYGAIHYARAQKIKYANSLTTQATLLSKANFKAVKLKAPMRTLIFRPGTGFKADEKNFDAIPTSGFYLTLAKDVHLVDSQQATDTQNYKPTRSVKVTEVTVIGNTTIVDYKKPLKGLPNKKIAKNHYRLTIKQLKTTGKLNLDMSDGTYNAMASWTNYQINNKPYYNGEIEYSDD